MSATLVVGIGTLAVTTTAAIRPAYAITFGSTRNLSNKIKCFWKEMEDILQ
jgi:hypothetical protein